MSEQAVFICGVYGTIETIIQVAVSLFILLSSFCQTQLPEWNRFFYLINILYLSNADCKTEYRVGLVEDLLPNGATITLNDTPFTADRTRIFAFIYGALGILGIISSLQLLVIIRCSSEVKKVPSSRVRGFWCLIMVLISFTDIVSTAIYLMDVPNTLTLSSIATYIGGIASGFQGNVVEDTWSAATAFVLYFSRLGGFWLFRVIFLWKLILLVTTITEDSDSMEDVESQPHVMRRPIPVRHNFQRTASLPQIRPKPIHRKPQDADMIVPNQRPFIISKYSHSEPCLDVFEDSRVEPDNKKFKLKFPSSLLSLPQRLEQIIREREKKIKRNVDPVDIEDLELLDVANFSFGKPIDRHNALEVWRERDVSKEARPRRLTDTDIRLLSYKEETFPALRGAKPWSYTPELAGGHRMRDQLPADEELPPVPVPDYTLHRRKPSLVHMTSVFPESHPARNSGKRESSVSTNDVLY